MQHKGCVLQVQNDIPAYCIFCFWIFCALADMQSQLQVVAAQIMMRSSRNTAATVFQAWRHRLADKTAARTAVRRVINRLQGVRNSQAFAAWQACVQQQQAQKAHLQKAVVRLQRLRCSDVLYHWQQHVAQRKAVQSRLARASRCCFWLALNNHAFCVRPGAAT